MTTSKPDLRVNLAPTHPQGLWLRNPVIAASGTFGYGVEFVGLVDIQRLGAIVCKGTTLHPRQGNPHPRTVETPCGMLNSVGLQNVGVDAVVEQLAPVWAEWDVPVIVNVAGETMQELAAVARRLDGVRGVAAIELNVSCPNIQAGGVCFGQDPSMAAEATRAVREACHLPLIVKLTPNVMDVRPVALAVQEAGAHAISLVNTFTGLKIDVGRRQAALGGGWGGLSGPAIKPLALYLVYQVAQVAMLPVIGLGGITTAEDALEFLMGGAAAVQIGTMHFADPSAGVAIVSNLTRWLERHRVARLGDIVGAVRVAGGEAQ